MTANKKQNQLANLAQWHLVFITEYSTYSVVLTDIWRR